MKIKVDEIEIELTPEQEVHIQKEKLRIAELRSKNVISSEEASELSKLSKKIMHAEKAAELSEESNLNYWLNKIKKTADAGLNRVGVSPSIDMPAWPVRLESSTRGKLARLGYYFYIESWTSDEISLFGSSENFYQREIIAW